MRRRVFVTSAAVSVAGFTTGCLHGDGGDEGSDNETDEEEGEEENMEDDQNENETEDGGTDLPSPRFVGAEFKILREESGTRGDEVSVQFDDESLTVRVEGTTFGNNSCYTAELGETEHDEEEGTLRLNVETFDDSGEDEFCTQVITEIEYRVTASFENALPRRVIIEHDGDTIAEARGGIGTDEREVSDDNGGTATETDPE